MPTPTRRALADELLARLTDDLAVLEREQAETHRAATHEQAKAENSKDTRALEQSYLARGQAMRVEALREAIARVKTTAIGPLDPGAAVELGALVTAGYADGERRFLLMPAGGGARLGGGAVQVVTPESPVGRALLGRRAGDEVSATVAGKPVELELLRVE